MGLYVGQLVGLMAFIEVELLKDNADPIRVRALLDTGADASHCAEEILLERGATYSHPITVDGHALSEKPCDVYVVTTRFPVGADGAPGLLFDMPTINTAAVRAPMIIGMGTLHHFDFTIKRNGQFFLEW